MIIDLFVAPATRAKVTILVTFLFIYKCDHYPMLFKEASTGKELQSYPAILLIVTIVLYMTEASIITFR